MKNASAATRSSDRKKDTLFGYLFLAPFLVFYLIFNLYPMIQGFIISFYKWNITGNKIFIAFQNYFSLATDKTFWAAMSHTFLYVLFSTPVFMLGAFILALIVDSKLLKGKTFVRAVYFLPNVLAVSIIAVIWLNMLQPYTGLMNSFIHSLGVEKEIFWLSSESLVWPSIVLITFWWNTGYYMLIYLAGLQDIPESLYEAAEIDGATWLQRIVYITFPSLKSTHLLIMFLQIVASFKIFGQVYLITGGGPGGASRTLLQYVYEVGFNTFLIGKASAASFVLLLTILVVSVFQLKIMNNPDNNN